METSTADSTLYPDNKAFNERVNFVPSSGDNDICDKIRGPSPVGIIKLSNGTPTIRHPLDSRENSFNSDSIDGEPLAQSSLNEVELQEDAAKRKVPLQLSTVTVLSDEEEDKSMFQAVLSPDTQDVRLKKEVPATHKRRLIPVPIDHRLNPDEISISSDDDFDEILSPSIESLDEIEDSILEKLDEASTVEALPQLTAEEESEEARYIFVFDIRLMIME